MTFLICLSVSNFDYILVDAKNDAITNTLDNTIKIVNATPSVKDPNLQIETVFSGIKFPTSMAFLSPNDILVLEKGEGTVRRIVNGNMLNEPLLDVNVANSMERGMLGIAISKIVKEGNESTLYVFLYYTETKTKDGEDLHGGITLGNRLYRYELVNNKLINPKLLLNLPVEPLGKGHGEHQGGVVLIGPDNNVYLINGDINEYQLPQNILNGKEPDGTSGILRMTQDGEPIGKGILGDTYPLNLYYAYGIRNSFGMDFDPVSGKLWDTENGLACCDEINMVEPGFNSGWAQVQGIFEMNQSNRLEELGVFNESSIKEKLVDFGGRGKYSSPEFTWYYTVGPSAIKFFNSDKLGKQYENDIFVGNVNHENLYHFDLKENRKGLLLKGNMSNKVLKSWEDPEDLVFATGLGRITDIDVGPDGNLYILAHNLNNDDQYSQRGTIFKISKSVENGHNVTIGIDTWINYDNSVLSASVERDRPISGSGSLRVDINPAETVEDTVNSSWKKVSTDFINAKGKTSYNYSLDVSAKDVNQLHSKVKYFDSKKNEIKEGFIFSGQDGTFEDRFNKSLLSPENTKYIKIQMWVRQSAQKPASYLVDNVQVAQNNTLER